MGIDDLDFFVKLGCDRLRQLRVALSVDNPERKISFEAKALDKEDDAMYVAKKVLWVFEKIKSLQMLGLKWIGKDIIGDANAVPQFLRRVEECAGDRMKDHFTVSWGIPREEFAMTYLRLIVHGTLIM